MSGIAVAVIALLLFAWEQNTGLTAVVVVVAAVLVLIVMAVVVGASLGHRSPSTTRWLLWLWTPGVLIVLGAVTAALAHFATLVAGKDATGSAKTFAALAVAVVVAIGTQAKDWLPKHLAPWLAKKVTGWQYSNAYFPCLPVATLPLGKAAWEGLSEASSSGVEAWTGPKLQALLQTIKDAVDAGQTTKDASWVCA